MSVQFECIHCQTPLDVERLENAKIVIDHFQKITGTDQYLIFEIMTIIQCQSCQKNNHILWEAKKMMNKEEVEKQTIDIAHGKENEYH
ncbi:MAG: hypothetical protein WAZ77_09875 [Candidatus Nitrosopolaris sp.]|jgi:hypothetical protein